MRLAARGARETASGVVPIDDAGEATALRTQATRVWRESLAIAVIATAVAMIARALFGA